jgi:hypothetical protein
MNHSLYEPGHEQRHVAARHVRDLDVARQGFQAGSQPLERPATFAFVAGDRDGCR